MSKVLLDFGQADKIARQRDLELERKQYENSFGASKEEIEKAMEIIAQATGEELYLGKKKNKFLDVIE